MQQRYFIFMSSCPTSRQSAKNKKGAGIFPAPLKSREMRVRRARLSPSETYSLPPQTTAKAKSEMWDCS
jgi:hypothetical protein